MRLGVNVTSTARQSGRGSMAGERAPFARGDTASAAPVAPADSLPAGAYRPRR